MEKTFSGMQRRSNQKKKKSTVSIIELLKFRNLAD